MFTKTLPTPSGFEADYWHRERVVLTDAGLLIETRGYKDAQAKTDGRTSLGDRSYFVGRDEFAALGLPDFTALTRAIVRAKDPDFSNAVDALAVAPEADPPPEAPT